MSWSSSTWSSFSGLTWSRRPRSPILGVQCLSSWVVHDIHNPELFIASTTPSCSLHPQPRVVHYIHNLELFITYTALSCSFHYNLELFIIFRHPWVIWPRVCVWHSLFWTTFRYSVPTSLTCSLGYNPELFIASQLSVVHSIFNSNVHLILTVLHSSFFSSLRCIMLIISLSCYHRVSSPPWHTT